MRDSGFAKSPHYISNILPINSGSFLVSGGLCLISVALFFVYLQNLSQSKLASPVPHRLTDCRYVLSKWRVGCVED